MLKKYEKRYLELQEKMKIDPWVEAGYWIDSQDWLVPGGLNLGQFIDCMSKLGSTIFSGRNFKDALPTLKDRVEHFFQTSMKLSEENYWGAKVKRRLELKHKMKSSKSIGTISGENKPN